MADYGVAVLRSPLHGWHVDRGAQLRNDGRWLVPGAYTGADQEVAAARNSVGLADLSVFTRLCLQGPAVPVLTWALTSDSPAMHPGGVGTFSAAGEVLACRVAEEELLLLGSSTHLEGAVQYLTSSSTGQRVVLTDVSHGLAEFCLVGPKALPLLGRLTAVDLGRALAPASCAATNLAGVHALLVHAPQTVAVRLCVAWELAEYLWDCLFEVGREFGIVPLGLEAVKAFVPLSYP